MVGATSGRLLIEAQPHEREVAYAEIGAARVPPSRSRDCFANNCREIPFAAAPDSEGEGLFANYKFDQPAYPLLSECVRPTFLLLVTRE